MKTSKSMLTVALEAAQKAVAYRNGLRHAQTAIRTVSFSRNHNRIREIRLCILTHHLMILKRLNLSFIQSNSLCNILNELIL
jgi:hypothetical protein